jgi:hypothetical protein
LRMKVGVSGGIAIFLPGDDGNKPHSSHPLAQIPRWSMLTLSQLRSFARYPVALATWCKICPRRFLIDRTHISVVRLASGD